MITSEIIADSFNPAGNRLTTYILEYPRFIHAEIMTHRAFSKNAASSRAIPIEKMIQQVIDNPAMPVFWGKNQSGMQANEELDNINANFIIEQEIKDCIGLVTGVERKRLTALQWAKLEWISARNKAIESVRQLDKLGLHKQIANRLLEPWFNIRIILSGTEFENFFALRAHKDAQPELQKLAYLMLEQYNNSTPKKLNPGEWHIPFGDNIDEWKLINTISNELSNGQKAFTMTKLAAKQKVAIARCARISYLNYEGKDDYAADIKLCDRLFGNNPKHLSPTEHVAQALDNSESFGNFRGFKQYRYFFNEQNLKDNRVINKFNNLDADAPNYEADSEDDLDLDKCDQCGALAWDGTICHHCGLKII